MSGLGGYLKQAMKTQEDQADFQKKVIESAALKAKDFGIDALNDPLWYEKTLERQKELATMDQIAKHTFTKMNQDISKSKYSPEIYYEGKNIRIITNEDFGSVTNEDGNEFK